jgi:sugar phosphate isomerase/epimerase
MLIGLCSSSIAAADQIAASGVDYIEENVQSFLTPEASESDFQSRLLQSRSCRKPIVAANCFLPGDLKCVGPGVNEARLLAWAKNAFLRAKQSGIGIIVFGSGGARTLAAGTNPSAVQAQFISLLRKLGPLAQEQGVVLAIEPLNRHECNFINTIAEGAHIVREAGQTHVRLLVDIFHMLQNDETPADMQSAKGLVVHAHIAERDGRTAPGTKGEDLRPYLRALRATGYDGRLSIECNWKDCFQELPKALSALKQQLKEAGYACA